MPPPDKLTERMELECERALQCFRRQRVWQCQEEADAVLDLVVQGCVPHAAEWQRRQAAIDRVRQVLAGMPDFQANPGMRDGGCMCKLSVFGSFCSSLYHTGSDLDLTISGKWRNRQGQILDMGTMSQRDATDMLFRIKRSLQQRQLAADDPGNPLQVINARVPLVVFTDAVTGIHMDVSVCNHGGAFKSLFMKDMVNFDQRFPALYRLVKLWAEAHNLNDPKAGTLNSWSITQMVIFHLQSSSPAILPPLWQLFHNEPSQQAVRPLQQPASNSNNNSSSRQPAPDFSLLECCQQQRRRYQGFYNTSSSSEAGGSSASSERGLLELLISFFVRFQEVLRAWLDRQQHTQVRMSTWLGRWHCSSSPWRQDYLVLFEDPFDAGDNTARTLGTASRNDAGGWRLLDAIDAAVHACHCLRDRADLDALLKELFHFGLQDMLAPGFDPIRRLQLEQQARQQQQQARQQQQLQARQQQQQQQQQQQLARQLPSATHPGQQLQQAQPEQGRQGRSYARAQGPVSQIAGGLQLQQPTPPDNAAAALAAQQRLMADMRLPEQQQQPPPPQQPSSLLLQGQGASWRHQHHPQQRQWQQQSSPPSQQVLEQQYQQHSVSGGANLVHRHAHNASSSPQHQQLQQW